MSLWETLKRIWYWLFFAFTVYIMIELIRKIFGGSLNYEPLLTSLLFIHLALTFKLWEKMNTLDNKFSVHLGWHKGQFEGDK